MDITQVFGIAGAVTYLASYFFLQLRFIDGNGFAYAFLNMAAAAMVLVSLTTHFNVGSLIIQVSFITLSLIGILRQWMIRRPVKVSLEEENLAKALLPDVPLRQAMPLIRKGHWVENGCTELFKEGKNTGALIYLAKGEARVSCKGREICKLGSGDLIGDFTCLTNEPASADVTLIGDNRYFEIRASDLRNSLNKDEVLRNSFDARLAREFRQKLVKNSHHHAMA